MLKEKEAENKEIPGKMPIVLLIGAGSRIPLLLERLTKPDTPAFVTAVISHKALQINTAGNKTQDVVGITEAKKNGIHAGYFNFTQMAKAIKEVNPFLEDKELRQQYFRILGAYLCQNYPIRPRAVFMLGWDIIVSEEFLKFFPGEHDGIYNIINLHPAQLPDNPEDKTVVLPSGIEIPVIRGEHDEVIKEAIRLRLPALGACMHFARPEADLGGYIIQRVEVSILYKDTDEQTFSDYEERLKVAESRLIIDVVDKFTRGLYIIDGTTVKSVT